MHIGLLTADLTPHHGWGNYGLNVLESLKTLGHDITVLSANNSDHPELINHHPILPIVVPQEPYFLAKLIRSTREASRLLASCDVIHTTIEQYAPLVQWIAKQRPTFMTAHGSYINLPRVRRFPVNHLYRSAFSASHIINVSHYTEKIAKDVLPNARTSVVVNAVDAMKFADIEHTSSSKPTIVTLGGVKARKGTHHLVEAIAKVQEQFPDIQCHVFGTRTAEVNYVAFVRQRIEDLRLTDAIHLHGFTEDDVVRDWYAKTDMFVLPSINAGWKFEGFGLATMEASAAGLPVIGTSDCGAEEVIDNGQTGLLISQANISEELPGAILHLLNDRSKARQMGLAGRQKAQSRTWEDVARELVEIYERDLKQKR